MDPSRNPKSDDRGGPTPEVASKSPILDDSDRPLSIMYTTNYRPQVSASTRDRQRSLATEILGPNYHLVFGNPDSQASVQDGAQGSAGSSDQSALSELLVRSLGTQKSVKPLPSLPGGQVGRSASFSSGDDKMISKPLARTGSTGSKIEMPAFPAGEASKAHRVSMFLENLEGGGTGKYNGTPTASGQVARYGAATPEWPLPTPTGSPRPENQAKSRPGLKSPVLSEISNETAMSPEQTGTSLVTIISPEARKSPRLRILPKFLRSKSPDDAPKFGHAWEYAGVERKARVKEEPRERAGIRSSGDEGVSPRSFFDDESSNGDEEESQVESAQQAMVARQGTVKKVELKEMLRSTPPMPGGQAESSRDQIVKHPTQNTSSRGGSMPSLSLRQDTGVSKHGPVSKSMWNETNPFRANAQGAKGSMPHTPAPISPSAPKPIRKVSFPPPAPLEIKPGHRFLRQSVISTPYPPDVHEDQGRGLPTRSATLNRQSQGTHGRQSILTLVSYGQGGVHPKVKRLTIPDAQNITLLGEAEKGYSMIKAKLTRDFDDQKLFKMIRKEYGSMRSGLGRLASARTMQSVKLLSYRSRSQLVSTTAKPVHFQVGDTEEFSAEGRMLSLLHKPKKGKMRHEWTQWIHEQPENTEESDITSLDKVALEIVEGWAPSKIAVAFTVVFVCSLAVALLWIFLGKSGNSLTLEDVVGAIGQLSGEKTNHRGAASRVGTGAVLGIFALSLGWFVIAAWILLSWLLI